MESWTRDCRLVKPYSLQPHYIIHIPPENAPDLSDKFPHIFRRILEQQKRQQIEGRLMQHINQQGMLSHPVQQGNPAVKDRV
jgi:hypothetical protein